MVGVYETGFWPQTRSRCSFRCVRCARRDGQLYHVKCEECQRATYWEAQERSVKGRQQVAEAPGGQQRNGLSLLGLTIREPLY